MAQRISGSQVLTVSGANVRPGDILCDHDYSQVLRISHEAGSVVVEGQVRRIDGSVGPAFWGYSARMEVMRDEFA